MHGHEPGVQRENQTLMKKMIFAGAGVLALMGVAIASSVFVMMKFSPAPTAVMGDPAAAMPMSKPEMDILYHHVQPEFVVNLPGGRNRFLMVEMSIATDDQKAIDVIDEHQPELRNDLLMLLGEQDPTSLAGNDGKLALRSEAAAVVDGLVERHYAPGRIRDVYLTRFVIQ